MIGFCGAHRTGKTTLASEVSRQLGVPLVDTGLRHVWGELGLDAKADYPLEKRIEIQHRLLDVLEQKYSAQAGRAFVADRTPICTAAYLLADVSRESDVIHGRAVLEYVERCIEVTNWHFSTVFVVHPGIPVVDAGEGKGPNNPAYIAHLDLLITGLAADRRGLSRFMSIPRHLVDLEARVDAVVDALERQRLKFMEQFSGLVTH